MRQHHSLRLLIAALSLSVLIALNWLFLPSHPPVALSAPTHAFVIGSDPVDGSTVASAPSVVRIFFDDAISPASVAHVLDPNEQRVDLGRSVIPSDNPRELDTPLLPPDHLQQGSYTVYWSALADGDGHATHGTIGFNIGHSSTGLSGQVILGPSTSNILPQLNAQGILSIAWDWLTMLALTFWIGILVMEGLILRTEQNGGRTEAEQMPVWLARARKQALPLQWLCLAALLVGEFINLILRAAQLTSAQGNSGINLLTIGSLILNTNYGHLWLIRIALIVVALALLNWATRRRRASTKTTASTPTRSTGNSYRQLHLQFPSESSISKERPTDTLRNPISTRPTTLPSYKYIVSWLIIAGLILLTLALSGDAAQLAQPHITAIVLNWLYLAAQCIWFGGIAYLGYVLLPLLPGIEPDHHGEKLATLLRRYTPLTLAALGILLVSLLFLSEASLSSAQQLLTDPYGRSLLVKILLIVSMLIFTGYALFFLRPKLTRQAALLPVVDTELPIKRTRQSALLQTERSLKQTMKLSSWLAAGILLCAALMTFFAPPIVFPAVNYKLSITSTDASTSGQNLQIKQIGDLAVTLVVLPARANSANTLILTMNDSSGNPVTNAQVELNTNMEIMNMGDFHTTVVAGNPTYIATFAQDTAFSMSGLWDIVVKIVRPNVAPVQGTFQVMLN